MNSKEKKPFNWNIYIRNWILVLTILAMITYFIFFTILWEKKWDIDVLFGNSGTLLFGLATLSVSCLLYASNRKKFAVTKWIIYVALMITSIILINSIGGIIIGVVILTFMLIEVAYNKETFKNYKTKFQKKEKVNDITANQ